jgi:hypothetical protein
MNRKNTFAEAAIDFSRFTAGEGLPEGLSSTNLPEGLLRVSGFSDFAYPSGVLAFVHQENMFLKLVVQFLIVTGGLIVINILTNFLIQLPYE